MELKDIKDLIKLVGETDVSEVQIELEGVKVAIKKNAQQVPITYIPEHYFAPAESAKQSVSQPTAKVEQPVNEKDNNLIEISAPMVGTFYRAPSPDSPPFVKEGDLVQEGQILCIIEAMKLMNEIQSEYSGRIVRILVNNAEPVEYGQPLFLLEPEK
ncbi:MAG: acetyl-CoA carboxylase biotin carboxyl carrier protein [Firmicutes bacterium]|nr:acetyl-CoA carboxylase biotin carboxyl carrier protein [Bacillota bacterium]